MTDKLHPAKRLLAGALAVIGFVAGALAITLAFVFAGSPMTLPSLALGIAGIVGAVVLLRVAGSGRRPSKRAALASVLGAIAPLLVLTVFVSSSMRPVGDRVRMAAMRTQLRRVARAETAYYAGRGKYTDDLSALDTTLFRPTPSVFLTVARADTMGWRAVATADGTAYICSLSVARAEGEGEVHDQELAIRCEK